MLCASFPEGEWLYGSLEGSLSLSLSQKKKMKRKRKRQIAFEEDKHQPNWQPLEVAHISDYKTFAMAH